MFVVDIRQDLIVFVRRAHFSANINPLQFRFQGNFELRFDKV